MYTNFNDLHKSYGLNNPNKTRDDLSEDEERAFVNDCFETYEYIGFADTFGTPYEGEKKYVGMRFTVLGRVKELSADKDGADLECLPMWNIQLENGDKIAAYPEEICLAERSFKSEIFERRNGDIKNEKRNNIRRLKNQSRNNRSRL